MKYANFCPPFWSIQYIGYSEKLEALGLHQFISQGPVKYLIFETSAWLLSTWNQDLDIEFWAP